MVHFCSEFVIRELIFVAGVCMRQFRRISFRSDLHASLSHGESVIVNNNAEAKDVKG